MARHQWARWLLPVVAAVATLLGLRDAVVAHAAFRERERRVFADCMGAILDRDEGNYMRVAERLRRGETPTDDVGGVSYRSVLFSLAALPALERFGCTGDALDALRVGVLATRLAIPLAAFLFLWRFGGEGRRAKAWLAMALLAWNSQLTLSSFFLPDVPSALLIITCLAALVGARRAGTALLAGGWAGLAVLVKADFLYALLVVMGVRLVAAVRSRTGVRAAVAALAGYALVLGAWAARNHAYTGRFFITSKDSVVLWIGNDAEARAHGFRYHPVYIPPEVSQAHAGEPIEVWGRRYFYERLWERIRAHPLEVAAGVASKFWLYLTNSGENNFGAFGRWGVWLGWGVNGLALLGTLLWLTRRWPAPPSPARDAVTVAWAASMAILAATIFEARYMVHALTLATLLSSWLAVDAARRWGGPPLNASSPTETAA